MGRRSDRSRAELETLILDEAHRQMEAVGFARFSARAIATAIGYSVGTLYHVHGSLDRLVLAVNARTLRLWTDHMRGAVEGADDRVAALVAAYFSFAAAHPHAWTAVYDHRLATGAGLPDWFASALADLTAFAEAEVARAVPGADAPALARSLLAVVHGHCALAHNGTLTRLGDADPQAAALARVREAIAAAQP